MVFFFFLRPPSSSSSFQAIFAASAASLATLNHLINEEEPTISSYPAKKPVAPNPALDQQFVQKIDKAKAAVQRYMAVSGAPGISVAVARNGRTQWAQGFGFADVETGAKCTADSVMRIASISKPITSAIAGHYMEQGRLDIDKSIHEYLSPEDFPKKTFNGKEVEITTRQLLAHTAGIRSYPKKDENAPDSTATAEFMSNRRYKSVRESLSMFKDDPLLSEPGTQLHYTTHGYTLLSAVLERVAGGREFKHMARELFRRLEMWDSHLDDAQEPVVARRIKYYKRNDTSHRLENVREVDNSYKLAGGGFLSSVGDLLKFANAILCSYQNVCTYPEKPPLLKTSTIRQLWTKNSEKLDDKWELVFEYGLGWALAPADGWNAEGQGNREQGGNQQQQGGGGGNSGNNSGNCFEKREYWCHSGGAVGTSSILLVKPTEPSSNPAGTAAEENQVQRQPQGICVAILVNCQDCPCMGLALELAHIFE